MLRCARSNWKSTAEEASLRNLAESSRYIAVYVLGVLNRASRGDRAWSWAASCGRQFTVIGALVIGSIYLRTEHEAATSPVRSSLRFDDVPNKRPHLEKLNECRIKVDE